MNHTIKRIMNLKQAPTTISGTPGTFSYAPASSAQTWTGAYVEEKWEPYAIGCNNCSTARFNAGAGGGEPLSQSETVVAAHCNGWYVGRIYICPDCRVRIAGNDQAKEEEK
jgi:hypothetical protein